MTNQRMIEELALLRAAAEAVDTHRTAALVELRASVEKAQDLRARFMELELHLLKAQATTAAQENDK